ncbi:MAG: glycoside hydrolase family 92 protein, partial [Cytophagales bacterium]
IIKQNYNTSRKGVPGNDDSGSMASWYAFHAMGFFPNAGQDVYLISKPTFEKTTINLENGKQFTIVAKKLTDKNIYIQSATLNGKPYTKNWFTHKEILNGGVFEFEMGSKPTSWGSKDLPPSMSDDK